MPNDWDNRASLLAEFKHEDDFQTRIGAVYLFDENAFYIFNNYPPKHEMLERDRKLKQIRDEAIKLGIQELGYGEYPKQGVNEGYSYVIIFAGDENQCQYLESIL